MSTIIIITPPPPPPPPQNPALAPVDLNQWYWETAYRQAYAAALAESPMVKIKRWFQSRTLAFNAFVGLILSTLVAYTGDVKEALGEYGAVGVVILVAGNAAWRFQTDRKLTK